MRRQAITIGLVGLLIAAVPLDRADAWYHADAGGSWAHTGRDGTASGHDGSWNASGYHGGTASGGDGAWHASGANGSTASGGYHGGYYDGYHPPTVVNHYSSGCYNCGGWNGGGAAVAGLAVGAVAGVAIASASANANTNSNANAYAAGVSAGASMAPVYAMSDVYPTLPGGCTYTPIQGSAFYRCGPTWFSPYYGANGTYYRVVPAP